MKQELNSDLLERVRSLPPKQQKRFTEMLETGEANPGQYADELRQDILAGKIDPNFSMATQYAIVALSDAKTPDRFESDAEALKTYKNEIGRLHEAGDENAAGYLESIVENVMKKENVLIDKVEAVRTEAQRQAEEQQEQAEAAFKQAFNELKQQRISELTEWNRMSIEQADKQFMALEHNKLVGSLRRVHGLV